MNQIMNYGTGWAPDTAAFGYGYPSHPGYSQYQGVSSSGSPTFWENTAQYGHSPPSHGSLSAEAYHYAQQSQLQYEDYVAALTASHYHPLPSALHPYQVYPTPPNMQQAMLPSNYGPVPPPQTTAATLKTFDPTAASMSQSASQSPLRLVEDQSLAVSSPSPPSAIPNTSEVGEATPPTLIKPPQKVLETPISHTVPPTATIYSDISVAPPAVSATVLNPEASTSDSLAVAGSTLDPDAVRRVIDAFTIAQSQSYNDTTSGAHTVPEVQVPLTALTSSADHVAESHEAPSNYSHSAMTVYEPQPSGPAMLSRTHPEIKKRRHRGHMQPSFQAPGHEADSTYSDTSPGIAEMAAELAARGTLTALRSAWWGTSSVAKSLMSAASTFSSTILSAATTTTGTSRPRPPPHHVLQASPFPLHSFRGHGRRDSHHRSGVYHSHSKRQRRQYRRSYADYSPLQSQRSMSEAATMRSAKPRKRGDKTSKKKKKGKGKRLAQLFGR